MSNPANVLLVEQHRAPMAAPMAEPNPMGYLTVSNPPRPGCPYGNCGNILGPHDVCGMTFYIACNMMLAFTLFFFV